ncbi:uncharacterized protein LOC111022947 [Momordica charantia]|uniref:Uncharacterized protein LOC111022947 n=1 Tax=Momordica charantia TaxID=3673 RepID=A0A6J1DPA4_MOMCH|nr:uncharacterized protein LOC111022947 [Momordica charantia]
MEKKVDVHGGFSPAAAKCFYNSTKKNPVDKWFCRGCISSAAGGSEFKRKCLLPVDPSAQPATRFSKLCTLQDVTGRPLPKERKGKLVSFSKVNQTKLFHKKALIGSTSTEEGTTRATRKDKGKEPESDGMSVFFDLSEVSFSSIGSQLSSRDLEGSYDQGEGIGSLPPLVLDPSDDYFVRFEEREETVEVESEVSVAEEFQREDEDDQESEIDEAVHFPFTRKMVKALRVFNMCLRPISSKAAMKGTSAKKKEAREMMLR